MSSKSRRGQSAGAVLRKALAATIAKHGWAVTGVSEDGACGAPGCTSKHTVNDPFLYTVGLTAAGLPELLLEHVPYRTAATVLNDLARQSTAAELLPGQVYRVVGILGRFTVTPMDQQEALAICKGVNGMYGRRAQVLRVNVQARS